MTDDLVAKLRDEDSYYRLQEKHWCIDAEELERQRLAAADRIEALSAESERLREKLIGIRAEIDDMENPFNGGGAPDAEYGFEVAVDQAFNIVTAALEGGE